MPPSCANSKSFILDMNVVTMVDEEPNGEFFNASSFQTLNHDRVKIQRELSNQPQLQSQSGEELLRQKGKSALHIIFGSGTF